MYSLDSLDKKKVNSNEFIFDKRIKKEKEKKVKYFLKVICKEKKIHLLSRQIKKVKFEFLKNS